MMRSAAQSPSSHADRGRWRNRRLAVAAIALLQLLGAGPAVAADDFLPPEQAFRVSAHRTDRGHAEVRVQIAPGYYLYRESLRFEAQGAALRSPDIPPGSLKFDEHFRRKVETFRGTLRIRLPLAPEVGAVVLNMVSQGCADAGLCYPPMTTTLRLDAP